NPSGYRHRGLLEPLGIDQRVDEINHDDDGHDRAEDVVEQHLTFFHRRARRGWKQRKRRRRSQPSQDQAWRYLRVGSKFRAAANSAAVAIELGRARSPLATKQPGAGGAQRPNRAGFSRTQQMLPECLTEKEWS